jgi:hypothetical protein
MDESLYHAMKYQKRPTESKNDSDTVAKKKNDRVTVAHDRI